MTRSTPTEARTEWRDPEGPPAPPRIVSTPAEEERPESGWSEAEHKRQHQLRMQEEDQL